MTVIPHVGSRRTVLHRTSPARGTRTGVMSTSAFAIAALVVMSVGLLTLLLLNTSLAKGSFRAHELRVQTAELAQREQVLRTQIEAASAPLTLTQRAKELGLVANVAPVFISLREGKVLGERYAAGTPIDPVTGTPQDGAAPSVDSAQDAAATDPAATQATQPDAAAPSAPAGPTESSATADSGTSPGVATTPGTGTEQPLGITGR